MSTEDISQGNTAVMSDFRHSFTIPVNDAARCWKIVDTVSIFTLFVLKSTNPVFKITLALHVGMQTILIFIYSPLVYYKAASIPHDDQSKKGLIQKITGFIPNMIKGISTLGLKVFLRVLRLFGLAKSLKLNINRLGSVMTYFLIMFRKTISLLVSIYVTSEDDESTHLKAFILFTVFMAIQMNFISSISNAKKSNGKVHDSNIAFKNSLKLLTNNYTSKSQYTFELLALLRKRISTITTLLTIALFYYTINHVGDSIDDNFVWTSIMKTLIAVDSLFVSTFLVELSGLKLSFSNSEDTLV